MAKAAIEKSRDPLREAIDGTRPQGPASRVPEEIRRLHQHAKDENVQTLPRDAAQALVTRFTREDENDRRTGPTRRTNRAWRCSTS